MKQVIFIFLGLCGLAGYGQTVNDSLYTKVNANGYEWLRGQFTKTFTLPIGSTNTLNGGRKRPGALFYNTADSSLNSYSGYQWSKHLTENNGWTLAGNAAATGAFIGTTNAEDLVFKVNGGEVGRFVYAAAGGPRIRFGDGHAVTNDYTFATGSYNTASGLNASVFGTNSTASGNYSVATGQNNTSSGLNSFTTGNNNIASGYHTVAMGGFLKSKSFAGVTIGQYNDSTNAASSTSFNAANRVLDIGIGTADNARASAMTVLYNGNVGIGTVTPDAKLHVNGTVKIVTGNQGAGKVLQSDANGVADWVTAASTTINIDDTLRFANVLNYGADPTGTVGSALAFRNAVATNKTVIVPPGRYKIEGIDSAITLNHGQTIMGIPGAELFTTTNGATTNLSTAMNFIILSNGAATVMNLKFSGNGKTTYSFPWTTQNGVWVYSNGNRIINCHFRQLRGTAILGVHPSLSLHFNNIVDVAKIDTCTQGIFTYANSEYWNFSNIISYGGDIGVNEMGANNNYVNCHFDYNRIGGRIYTNNGNSDHSGFVRCTFNHNSAKNLEISGMVNSLVFTNCATWSSPVTVDNSVHVLFLGHEFGSSCTLTVSGTSTDKYTRLSECYKASTASFVESGTGKIIENGTFNSSITSYNFNKTVGVGTTAPVSTLEVNGSFGSAIRLITTDRTLDATDRTIIVTSGTPVITLPAASGATRREYVIVNHTGSGVTISSYTDMAGAASTSVAATSAITIQSDGTNWYRIK